MLVVEVVTFICPFIGYTIKNIANAHFNMFAIRANIFLRQGPVFILNDLFQIGIRVNEDLTINIHVYKNQLIHFDVSTKKPVSGIETKLNNMFLSLLH